MLPEKAIQEFKELYRKIFHKNLSNEEASRLANYVLEFYEAVYLSVETEQ